MRDPIIEAYKKVIFESEEPIGTVGKTPNGDKFNIPKYLYHGTYNKFLHSILKNGLGGNDETGEAGTFLNKNNENTEGYVYLAANPEEAEKFAKDEKRFAKTDETNAKKMLDSVIVLQIDTDRLKETMKGKLEERMQPEYGIDSSNVPETPETFKYAVTFKDKNGNEVFDPIKGCIDIFKDNTLIRK